MSSFQETSKTLTPSSFKRTAITTNRRAVRNRPCRRWPFCLCLPLLRVSHEDSIYSCLVPSGHSLVRIDFSSSTCLCSITSPKSFDCARSPAVATRTTTARGATARHTALGCCATTSRSGNAGLSVTDFQLQLFRSCEPDSLDGPRDSARLFRRSADSRQYLPLVQRE